MTNQVPKSKKNQIVIDEQEPFKNCKLNRLKYAEILTNIVQNYSDGFVLAINNEWGTGKTTFLRMWEQHLVINKFKTLHFNAWKNDFSSNPFLALISQLGILEKHVLNKTYHGFLSKSATFIKKIGPGLIKGFAKKHIDDPDFLEAINVSAEITADSLDDQIDKQLSTEKDIDDFRVALTELVNEASDGKPIVFIIDELDRCRPDYAVAVLEQIKHFFAIGGIVFVLAIDKEQLGHAVRGVYGSDKINADEYLRRFIDLEYSIPDPEYKDYCSYLYDYYNFDEFLASEKRKGYPNLPEEREQFIKFTSSLFNKTQSNLRFIEKIFFRARVAINSFETKEFVFPALFIYLIFTKFSDEELYKKLINKQATLDELASNFENYIKHFNESDDLYLAYWTEAQLIIFYTNYFNKNREYDNQISILIDTDNNLLFKSTIEDKHLLEKGLKRAITTINGQYNYAHLSLSHLLDKIELVEDFKYSESS